MNRVILHDITEKDLSTIFKQENDLEAAHMAAFTSEDPSNRAEFDAHWEKVLHNDAIIKKTIFINGEIAGYITKFELFGLPTVGYWLGRAYWGKGIATEALTLLLVEVSERPLYARVANDNTGSRRVLEKCGFILHGKDKGFANARDKEIEEYIFVLNA